MLRGSNPMFEIEAKTPKMVHSAMLPCVTHYFKLFKILEKHLPGAQVSKYVHLAAKMCMVHL